MAWTSGFFNSDNGDRLYTAEQLSAIFNGLITDGVYQSVGNKLAVQPNSGMAIQINTGRGWFNGHWADNDSPYIITLENSDVTLNRYAAICVKSDDNYSVRTAEPYVKYSNFATNPVKPSMERSEVVKEYCLAYVLIRAGANVITAADIEDTRANSELCGWVTGLIDQVDSNTLWEQWEAEFNDWFDRMKNQLSGDVAGNLQVQIDDVSDTAKNAMPKFSGSNPITDITNDTVENWVALGSGLYFFDTNGQVTNKPDEYGWVFNIVSPDFEIRQLWLGRPSERIYHRGGNRSGFHNEWRQLIDATGGGFTGKVWSDHRPPATGWTFKNNSVTHSDGSTINGDTAVIIFRRK